MAAGQKSRDEIVSYFARLFRGKLVYSSELYPAELLDDIERAYAEGLVDRAYIRFDNIKRDLSMGKERILARLADNPNLRLVA